MNDISVNNGECKLMQTSTLSVSHVRVLYKYSVQHKSTDLFFALVTCMVLCTPGVPNFCTNLPVLLFGYFPVEILISNRIQRVMSQMKENKFLSDQIYNLLFVYSRVFILRVMIELIY